MKFFMVSGESMESMEFMEFMEHINLGGDNKHSEAARKVAFAVGFVVLFANINCIVLYWLCFK
jgi:hypothetical protein